MAEIPLNLPFGKLRAGSLRKGEVFGLPLFQRGRRGIFTSGYKL